jgi:hypothetical protein
VQYQFKISAHLHQTVYQHLLPGDGLEAVGIILCGFHQSSSDFILLAKEFYPINYEQCDRGGDYVHWKTDLVLHLLEKANKHHFAVVKIHSHPGGYDQFSWIDDESDQKLLPSLYGWIDGEQPHGSCVMLPTGEIFGRIASEEGHFTFFNKVIFAGDEIKIWTRPEVKGSNLDNEITLRNRQTLGDGTVNLLKSLKVGVVGASGTGSPVIEQLSRLGIGELVICDPDVIEYKNLNRILNSTLAHAEKKVKKVDVMRESIQKIGLDTVVRVHANNLFDSKEALADLSSCDVLFGCMDSVDGRHLLNQLATFYIIPYFDLGIKIEADGLGGIEQINGVVHFIKPGGSSLLKRGTYTLNMLQAAGLKRKNPDEFNKRVNEKYIVNIPVDRPAVISINMQVASIAVNEFLDRIHRFKNSNPSSRASIWISITEDLIICEGDGEPDLYLQNRVGRGDMAPRLEMPDLQL